MSVRTLTLEDFKKEMKKLVFVEKENGDALTSDDPSAVINRDLTSLDRFHHMILYDKFGIDYEVLYDLMLTADRIYGCFNAGNLSGFALVDITISGYYVECMYSLENNVDEWMLNRIEQDAQMDGKRFIYLNAGDADRFARHGFVPMHRKGVIWELWRSLGIKRNYWSGILSMTTLMLKKIEVPGRQHHPQSGKAADSDQKQDLMEVESESEVGQVRIISLDQYKQALHALAPISMPPTRKEHDDTNSAIFADLQFIEERKNQIASVSSEKLCREELFIPSPSLIDCDKIYACFSGHLRGVALVEESDSGYHVSYLCSSGNRCGQQILAKMEEDARKDGKRFIYLKAMTHAVEWYKKQGFTKTNSRRLLPEVVVPLMHREVPPLRGE